MLFHSNILVCNIVSESEYVINNSINLEVTFGGNAKKTLYKDIFKSLQDLGIVGSDAKYLECLVEGSAINLIYYTLRRSGDMSKNIIEYRKVSLPCDITSVEKLKQYVEREIQLYLNPFYFFIDFFIDSNGVELVSGKEDIPSMKEVEEGLKFLKDLYSTYNHVGNLEAYRYCYVGGNTFIIGILENNGKREYVFLPVKYGRNYLVEYFHILTQYSEEKIEDIISNIVE